jgi:hypothetical protein
LLIFESISIPSVPNNVVSDRRDYVNLGDWTVRACCFPKGDDAAKVVTSEDLVQNLFDVVEV